MLGYAPAGIAAYLTARTIVTVGENGEV